MPTRPTGAATGAAVLRVAVKLPFPVIGIDPPGPVQLPDMDTVPLIEFPETVAFQDSDPEQASPLPTSNVLSAPAVMLLPRIDPGVTAVSPSISPEIVTTPLGEITNVVGIDICWGGMPGALIVMLVVPV